MTVAPVQLTAAAVKMTAALVQLTVAAVQLIAAAVQLAAAPVQMAVAVVKMTAVPVQLVAAPVKTAAAAAQPVPAPVRRRAGQAKTVAASPQNPPAQAARHPGPGGLCCLPVWWRRTRRTACPLIFSSRHLWLGPPRRATHPAAAGPPPALSSLDAAPSCSHHAQPTSRHENRLEDLGSVSITGSARHLRAHDRRGEVRCVASRRLLRCLGCRDVRLSFVHRHRRDASVAGPACGGVGSHSYRVHSDLAEDAAAFSVFYCMGTRAWVHTRPAQDVCFSNMKGSPNNTRQPTPGERRNFNLEQPAGRGCALRSANR